MKPRGRRQECFLLIPVEDENVNTVCIMTYSYIHIRLHTEAMEAHLFPSWEVLDGISGTATLECALPKYLRKGKGGGSFKASGSRKPDLFHPEGEHTLCRGQQLLAQP